MHSCHHNAAGMAFAAWDGKASPNCRAHFIVACRRWVERRGDRGWFGGLVEMGEKKQQQKGGTQQSGCKKSLEFRCKCRHAVLSEQLKSYLMAKLLTSWCLGESIKFQWGKQNKTKHLKITSDILSKKDASYTANHEPIFFFCRFFLYHLGPQAIFSFVPEGASSAHLVLGQVPHYAIKPGTLVWTDAESLHGGANGTTWGGWVSHFGEPQKIMEWKTCLELDVGSLKLDRTVSKKNTVVVLSCFLGLHPFFSLLSTIWDVSQANCVAEASGSHRVVSQCISKRLVLHDFWWIQESDRMGFGIQSSGI